MLAVNYSTLRENMKSCMDKVSDDYETIIVTRKDNRNIVMLSEESYNNIMENLHVLGNEHNLAWLLESKAQLEAGKVHYLNAEPTEMPKLVCEEQVPYGKK